MSSVPRNAETFFSRVLWMSCVPQMKRTEDMPSPYLPSASCANVPTISSARFSRICSVMISFFTFSSSSVTFSGEVDSTFTTPWLMKPFAHGADLVFHSATKFLCGHGTVVGGLLGSGTIFYMLVENWSFVDALYFSTTIFSTVGFGDIAAQTERVMRNIAALLTAGGAGFEHVVGRPFPAVRVRHEMLEIFYARNMPR